MFTVDVKQQCNNNNNNNNFKSWFHWIRKQKWNGRVASLYSSCFDLFYFSMFIRRSADSGSKIQHGRCDRDCQVHPELSSQSGRHRSAAAGAKNRGRVLLSTWATRVSGKLWHCRQMFHIFDREQVGNGSFIRQFIAGAESGSGVGGWERMDGWFSLL